MTPPRRGFVSGAYRALLKRAEIEELAQRGRPILSSAESATVLERNGRL
jgi:hypothetical protein